MEANTDSGLFCCCQKRIIKDKIQQKNKGLQTYENNTFIHKKEKKKELEELPKNEKEVEDNTVKQKRILISEADQNFIKENFGFLNSEFTHIGKTIEGINHMTQKLQTILKNLEISPEFCERFGIHRFDRFSYRKLEKLGKGSFGVVWKCMEVTQRKLTAVKFMKLRQGGVFANKESIMASFLTERLMLKILGKDNNVALPSFLGEYYEEDGCGGIKTLILISEAGDFNLGELLNIRASCKTPAYEAKEALQIIAQLLEGYKKLKELGIYHSDTKLSNIVFSLRRKGFMIVDFGVSKIIPLPNNYNEQDTVFVSISEYAIDGTINFSSPEKKKFIKNNYVSDVENFDPFKCDMWSLGRCLERMVEGGLKNSDNKKAKILLNNLLNGLLAENPTERMNAYGAYKILAKKGYYSSEVDLMKNELPYIEKLENKRKNEEGFENMFDRLTQANMNKDQLNLALREYQLLLKENNGCSGHNEKDFIPILKRLGISYEGMGQYDNAIEIFIKLKSIYEKSMEIEKSQEITRINFRLAYNFEKLGQNQKAKDILQNELDIVRSNKFGLKKKNLVFILEKTAEISRNLGDHHKALSQFEEVLDLKLKIFNTKDHVDVINTISQIASQNSLLGEHKKAQELFQEVLAIQTKLYKTQEHPKIASTLCQIAVEYRNLGEHYQAMDILENVLKTQHKIYETEEHPDVATTMSLIAIQLSNLGKFKEALNQFERVLEIQKKVFKLDNHPEIVTTLSHIAGTVSNLGDHYKALEKYREVLNIRLGIYKTEIHPDVAHTLGNIAEQIRDLGDHKTALDKFLKVLEIEKKIYKTDKHPQVATTIAEIAGQYTLLRDNEKALEMFKIVYDIECSIYGTEQHPEVATTLSQEATLYSNMGDHMKALTQYKRVLAIRIKCFKSEDHPKVLSTMELIAGQHMALGEFGIAIKLLEKVLAYQMVACKKLDNPKNMNIYFNIGFCEESLGNHIKGLEVYQHLMEILTENNDIALKHDSLVVRLQRRIKNISKKLKLA